MALLRETYYLYLRNLKIWVGQPWAVVSSVLGSAFVFLFFGAPLGQVTQLPLFPTGDYNAYLTGMVLVMTVVFSGSDMAFAVLTDILSGYFDKLLLAPIHRLAILFGTLLVGGTRALIQVVIIVLLALALGVSFKTGVVGILAAIVIATVFGIAWTCLGLIIALKTKSAQVTQSSWLLFMPLAFLTTAFMPKEYLSGWFKVAVTFNPVDYVVVAVRAIVIQGWAWEVILPGLYVLAVMTAVLTAGATWVYRRATA
ncbi:MAG: ABC transporter permease [Chloroflexi bacterium]|nr:ABC transporter permease [Chloroflexota bacterium]